MICLELWPAHPLVGRWGRTSAAGALGPAAGRPGPSCPGGAVVAWGGRLRPGAGGWSRGGVAVRGAGCRAWLGMVTGPPRNGMQCETVDSVTQSGKRACGR